MKKAKKPKINKNPVPFAEHDLEVIRMKYCGGIESLKGIAEEFGTTIPRLTALAKRHKWERVKFADGARVYGRKDLVIRGVKVVYVGPLTPEERAIVSASTADIVHASIEPHRHAAYMAILLVNQYLAKLLANGGMEERIILPKKVGDEAITMLVPGQDQLLTLAKVLGYVVPIDRQTMGLDDKPGRAGEMSEEARNLQAKANAEALVKEFGDIWAEKLAKVPAPVMIPNGHANGSAELVSLSAKNGD